MKVFLALFFFVLCFLQLLADDQNGFFNQLPPIQRVDSLLLRSANLVYDYPDSSLLYSEKVINILQYSSDVRLKDAHKNAADALYYLNDFDSAIIQYGLAASEELKYNGKNSLEYALRINDMGYCYYVLGIYDIALQYYETSLQILTELQADDELISTISNIGTVYLYMGSYENAINYFEEALAYDIKSGHDYEASVSMNNIGKVYQAWGKHQQALQYLNRSLDYAMESENRKLQAIRMSNVGMVYLDMGDAQEALKMLNNALDIDSLQNNVYKVAIRQSEISRVYAGMGKYQKAITMSLKALTFFNSAGISESKAIVYNDLGSYYLAIGDFENARIFFELGASISMSMSSRRMLLNAWIGLANLYESKGGYKDALLYQKLVDSLDKVIFNEKSHQQIANFEIKYRTREAEIENALLKNEVQQRRVRITLLLIGIGSLLIILILLIRVYSLNRMSLKQQKLVVQFEKEEKERERIHYEDKVFAEKQINRLQREKFITEIGHKNQLLVNSTLGLLHKNEVLAQLKEKVKLLPSNEYSQDISNLIRENIDLDQNWQKFRLEFSEIHPDFFESLLTKFPALSELNLQLCAYLRINLSSKEIANLQNISVSAVNKNRQRLRKKFNLAPEADLNSFLTNFE